MHGAPPCKTFSTARRVDRFAKVRRLRSRRNPAGFDPKPTKVRDANLLVSRLAQLCRLQWQLGGVFSIENPENSIMWLYKPIAKLNQLDGVRFVCGDQCRYGHEHRKPTAWLTNSSHLDVLERRCLGGPGHAREPLQGFTQDFWGRQVFKTELAAEYPQGLCETLAKSFEQLLKEQPKLGPIRSKKWTEDRPEDPDSRQARQEAENTSCVGGLRNPRLALRKVKGLVEVGAKLAHTLDAFLGECANRTSIVRHLGNEGEVDLEPDLNKLQHLLSDAWRCKRKSASGLWGDMLSKLVESAHDPDREAASWPELGTPLGLEEPLAPGGVFPKLEATELKDDRWRLLQLTHLAGALNNYQSYEQNAAEADALFWKEVEAGYVEWTPNRTILEAKVGKLVPSAVGVIVKQDGAGKRKVRLVHDLRRSQINSHIAYEERLVLPRLNDAVEDVMYMLETRKAHEQVCLVALDFKDAFKQLWVRQSERKYLSGQIAGGFFAYFTVLFGICTGPLVWGRLAALVGRLTQALMQPSRGRLQIYMDDPFLCLQGSETGIAWEISKVLWWWRVLGLQISWRKGISGLQLRWIGAELVVDPSFHHLTVRVPADKVQEWADLIDKLLSQDPVSRKALQRLAGKLSWAGGIAPQLKPFTRMLYAALKVQSPTGQVYPTVSAKQVRAPLHWLKAFASGFSGGIERKFVAHERHRVALHVVTDASPWGGGAYSLNPDAGELQQFFSVQWSPADETLLDAKIGDAGSQALWEAYIILLALQTWLSPESQGAVKLQGDASGILQAFVRRSAASPKVNAVVRELALELALNHRCLEGLHLYSEENKIADALSRLFEPGAEAILPKELHQAIQVQVQRRPWRTKQFESAASPVGTAAFSAHNT